LGQFLETLLTKTGYVPRILVSICLCISPAPPVIGCFRLPITKPMLVSALQFLHPCNSVLGYSTHLLPLLLHAICRTVKAVINYEAAKDIDTHIHRSVQQFSVLSVCQSLTLAPVLFIYAPGVITTLNSLHQNLCLLGLK